jgi:catechol 2,3-dioxygenase-like lactoylglutathione lyase family enzyme
MVIDIQDMTPLVQVFDMPTSLEFYCKVLGFEIVSTDESPSPNFNWVLLKLNGIHLMLNTAYEAEHRPPQPDPARVAAHEDVCLYFGTPDVDAMYQYLRGQGLSTQEPKVAPYGMKQLYVKDPDGYNLCFQWSAHNNERVRPLKVG